MEESTSKSFYSNANQTMSDMYMYNNNNIAHSYLEERAYPFWGQEIFDASKASF